MSDRMDVYELDIVQKPFYNLYKDSCSLIGWIAFIILTIESGTKYLIALHLGQ